MDSVKMEFVLLTVGKFMDGWLAGPSALRKDCRSCFISINEFKVEIVQW